MSNVLGVLFQDIADAIRSKTGSTGTMAPIDFPQNINAIVTESSSSGGIQGVVMSSGGLGSTNDIDAASTLTIEHNLGVIPDIILMYQNVFSTSGTTSPIILGYLGFSNELLTATGCTVYPRTTFGATAITDEGVHKGFTISDTKNDITSNDTLWGTGGIRNATTTTFEILGTTVYTLPPDGGYTWVAIGGLVSHSSS